MELKVFHEDEWREYPAKTYVEYTYEWLGEPHESESVRLDGVGNEAARNPIRGFQGWVGAGDSSAEFISGHHVKFPSAGTTLDHEISIPEGATSIHVYFWIRGTEQPSAYDDGRTGLHFTFVQDGRPRISVAAAPNDGEWHLIEKNYTFQGQYEDISEGGLKFNSSGNWSANNVELKEVQVTFDNAPRPDFFDGDTPPSRAWVNFTPRNASGIKRIWPRSETPPPAGTHYAWLGEPHASESVMLDSDGNETARNLVSASTFTIANGVRSGGRITLTKDGAGDPGIYILSSFFVENVHYALSFKARLVSGEVTRMGGHLAHNYNSQLAYKDGQPVSGDRSAWQSPLEDSGLYDNDPHTYDVLWETITDYRTSAVWVQPNRQAYGPNYELELWDFQLTHNETPVPYFDGDTSGDRAHDLWYNQDGVPHEWVNGRGWVAQP